MQMTPQSIARFFQFIERLSADSYPEQTTTWHTEITIKALDYLFGNFRLSPTARILDVGCGQGVALKPFKALGYTPVGITLNEVDAEICCKLGFNVRVMDQSFLDFDDATFDLVWARHVVEHSFMPLYTLTEFRRILRPGGILYLEVPAPDTLQHENNPNHYSVFGKTMWESLIKRAGFTLAGSVDFYGTTEDGRSDEYWGMFAHVL